jgi:RimJ/RimL family protein N-acetyltransferase
MIETARLLLRPMRFKDTDALWQIFADPAVMAAFDAEPFDRRQMEGWVRKNLAHQERHGYGLCSVSYKANGELIGDCGLTQMTIGDATVVELGYDLRSDYWRQGLATEAAAAIRDHAFQTLRLPRLVSLIRRENRASRRVAEKIGMAQAEEITQHGHDYWVYACAPEGFAPAEGEPSPAPSSSNG